MKSSNFIGILLGFVCIYLLTTCENEVNYPIRPVIEYLSYDVSSRLDSNITRVVTITFYFQDGDGDIGDFVADTTVKANLFYTLYVKQNGEYSEFIFDDTINFRIPFVYPSSYHKAMTGKIEVDFEYFKSNKPGAVSDYDTLKYDLYINDRAGHRSNTTTSEDIPMNW